MLAGALIIAILGVFGFVLSSLWRAPDAPPVDRVTTVLTCRIDALPRDANGEALLPARFEITQGARQGRSSLDMTGRSPRLSLMPSDVPGTVIDNVTEGQRSFTITLAEDGFFDITLWQDTLRGAVFARGSGACTVAEAA